MKFLIGFLFFLSSLSIQPAGDLTIYLFRHAEKMTGNDPGLTEAGKVRAQNLLHTLNLTQINGLYSTDYKRTQETIQPLSDMFEMPVQSYNPRDLKGFSDELKSKEGVYLVSGHSNTTPVLATLLSGVETPPLDESEYDNLYIVRIRNGEATLTVLNYPPFQMAEQD
jgi:broad specificity phosphatase PhoE